MLTFIKLYIIAMRRTRTQQRNNMADATIGIGSPGFCNNILNKKIMEELR